MVEIIVPHVFNSVYISYTKLEKQSKA